MPRKRHGLFLSNTKPASYKKIKLQSKKIPSDTDTASECSDSDTFNNEIAVPVCAAASTPKQPTPVPVRTDSASQTAQQPHIMDISTMQHWLEQAGTHSFLDDLQSVIEQGLLSKGNICFHLFAELLKKLKNPNTFTYGENTLLWWLCGMKQYGGKWLRNMRGVPTGGRRLCCIFSLGDSAVANFLILWLKAVPFSWCCAS